MIIIIQTGTFLSPDVPASLFKARRNAPDAWGAYNISAGWVSDIDLYRHRQSFVLGALAGAELKRNGGNATQGLEKVIASTLNRKWLQTALSDTNDQSARGTKNSLTGSKNLDIPIFLSGVDAVDYCEDHRFTEGALQLVQEEGDLILIPPRFWHQVYHLEPSIALASQYVNDVGKDTTYRHIFNWCRRGNDEGDVEIPYIDLLPKGFETLSQREQVLSVIQTGLRLKHGRIKGSALMKKLLSNTPEEKKIGG